MSRRRRQDADANARARLVEHARRTILGDIDDKDPYFAAYQALAQGASSFLDASAPPAAARRNHRRTALTIGAFVASSTLVGVGVVAIATQTTLLDFTGLNRDTTTPPEPSTTSAAPTATAPVVIALPRPDAWSLPIRLPDGDISGIVDGVVTALNEQRAAEAQALAEQAAAQQPSSGGSTGTGTNTGGGSTGGGTSNGGGGQNPPPPPPAAFVDQLGFTASSTVGGINVSASVHTTGSMNVTVQCTSAGSTINLAGPSPLDGSGSYSGSFTGLAPGTYQISCAVPGQLSSNTKNITVYE